MFETSQSQPLLKHICMFLFFHFALDSLVLFAMIDCDSDPKERLVKTASELLASA